jgi:hypothetical protein
MNIWMILQKGSNEDFASDIDKEEVEYFQENATDEELLEGINCFPDLAMPSFDEIFKRNKLELYLGVLQCYEWWITIDRENNSSTNQSGKIRDTTFTEIINCMTEINFEEAIKMMLQSKYARSVMKQAVELIKVTGEGYKERVNEIQKQFELDSSQEKAQKKEQNKANRERRQRNKELKQLLELTIKYPDQSKTFVLNREMGIETDINDFLEK